MAENKKSFVLYADMMSMVEKLPPDKAGLLFLHILKYVNDLNPVSNDVLVDIAFEPIKMQLKRDLAKWGETRQTRSETGRLGGIASGIARSKTKQNEATVNLTKQNEANEAVNVNDSVNVSVSVNDTVTVNTINLDNAETSSAVIDENILIEDEVIETETISFEEPKTVKKEKKGSAEKKESPFMNRCKDIFMDWYRQNRQNYIWKPMDDKALGGVINQLKQSLTNDKNEKPSSEKVIDLLKVLLNKLPDWYKQNANSVSNINSSYNNIINQIKNERTKNKSVAITASDIMAKYYKP